MISVVFVRLFSMVFATTVFSIWMLSTLVLFTYISELFEWIFVPFTGWYLWDRCKPLFIQAITWHDIVQQMSINLPEFPQFVHLIWTGKTILVNLYTKNCTICRTTIVIFWLSWWSNTSISRRITCKFYNCALSWLYYKTWLLRC